MDHCPAGSNEDPVLVSWQGHPDSDYLVFHAVHDAMYHNKVPRAFGGKTAPQKFTETLPPPYLHTVQVIFGISVLYFTPNKVAEKATFSFNLTIEHGSSQRTFREIQALAFVVKFQERLFSGMPSK